MKILIKSLLTMLLVFAFNNCAQKNLNNSNISKIDQSLTPVDAATIKYLVDSTNVALEWKTVGDSRSNGYYIYRGEAENSNQILSLVKTFKSRYVSHYLDKNLKPNTNYLYAISSIGKNRLESNPSKSIKVKTMETIDSVSFLAAVSKLPGQIKIVWRPHTNLSIQHYLIQRKSFKDPEWKTVKKITGRLNAEHIDTGLGNNEPYLYQIISKSFDGVESKPSKIVEAKTKPLPLNVNNIQATKTLFRRIELSWDTQNTKDIKYYKIYRGSSPKDIFFGEIAKVNSDVSFYTDKINSDGKRKFYKITLVDKDNLESSLNFQPIMGKTQDELAKPIITLAQINTNNQAILNWISADNRTQSYNVYRTEKKGIFNSKTTFKKNITSLRYQDSDIKIGVKYEYQVQAVGKNGIKSKKTSPALLYLPINTLEQ